MEQKKDFTKEVFSIALPVTLQSLLQSSFSVVDQVMTGQLGSISIAGIGLGSKFASVYSVLTAAVAAAAGIMIAQYVGKKDSAEVRRSFYSNLFLALFLAVGFTLASELFPRNIIGLYSQDGETIKAGAEYLGIYGWSFLPLAVTSLLSAYLRCVSAASLPLYAGIFSAVLNTGLNYILIFGRFGFPAMGIAGAAYASVIAQVAGCVLLFLLFQRVLRTGRESLWERKESRGEETEIRTGAVAETPQRREKFLQYMGILLPILFCEFFWSLGENVYTSIYGHIGTGACAAMTLTGPIQGLMMGALSGVSQAAGVMIGRKLGAGETQEAYQDSVKLMKLGFFCSLVLSFALVFFARYYVLIFRVEEEVRLMAKQLLFVFALVSPVKVQNMILGGGILRSGGKTKYVLAIDFIGTWGFGVPLGLLAAFVWNLPISTVYFILSLEEGVRLFISGCVFRNRSWMKSF